MSDSDPMLEIQRTRGRLEGKVDALGQDVGGVKASVGSIDKRMRRVEGRTAAIGSIGGGIMAIGIDMLKKQMGI